MLGIKGDSVGLAILTAKLPLHLPLKRLKGLLGLFQTEMEDDIIMN
jgi:hypothetical protein